VAKVSFISELNHEQSPDLNKDHWMLNQLSESWYHTLKNLKNRLKFLIFRN